MTRRRDETVSAMRTNLHHLLEEQVHGDGGRPAVTYSDVTYTYAELWADASVAWPAGCADWGCERGDRVAVFLDKRIETVAAIFGTSAAGGVFVPGQPGAAARPGRPTSSPTAPCGCSSPRAERLAAAARRARGAAPRSSTSSLVATAGAAGPARRTTTYAVARLDRPSDECRRRPPSRRASTWTWRRSSTPPAAPASRRVSCSVTAT